MYLKTSKPKSETDPPIFKSLLERGDLDFVEQLWVLMRKSKSVPLLWTSSYLSVSEFPNKMSFLYVIVIVGVTSYQDVGDCLKLVIDALRFGDIKPWVLKDTLE